MKKKIAVLICTFDGAKDLWDPLHQTYLKYWPDCPYKIYLTTNYEDPSLELFTPLCIGEESSWSDNILKSLDLIEESHVLLTFDDLFLYKTLDASIINGLLQDAVKKEWDYCRLHPSPLPDIMVSGKIGKIKQNSMYRSSTVLAMFNKKVLVNLLDENESAWEFERNGSVRSNRYEHFYCTNQVVFPYLNGVVKGKWIPSVLAFLKNDGIKFDNIDREVMTIYESMIEKGKKMRIKLFLFMVPSNYRLRVKEMLGHEKVV